MEGVDVERKGTMSALHAFGASTPYAPFRGGAAYPELAYAASTVVPSTD
jgi:hypothetical protein